MEFTKSLRLIYGFIAQLTGCPTIRWKPFKEEALMMKKISTVAAAAIFLSLNSPSEALSESTGLTFLKLGVGARAQSMGSANTAAVRDASATYWNPAEVSRLLSKEFFAYHNQFVQDFAYSYISYAHPFPSRRMALGLSFGRFTKGTFEGRDDAGNRTSDFTASDNLLSVSVGRNLGDRFSLGTNLKFIQSGIQSYSAAGFAFDLAGSYRVSAKTNVSAGVFHAGPSLKYSDRSVKLPATFSLGASQKISILTLASDFRYGLNDGKTSLSFGAEADVGAIASLRAGYVSEIARNRTSDSKSLEQFAGLGMGVGLKLFKQTSFDYAFLPMGELGVTHHMSLSWRLK